MRSVNLSQCASKNSFANCVQLEEKSDILFYSILFCTALLFESGRWVWLIFSLVKIRFSIYCIRVKSLYICTPYSQMLLLKVLTNEKRCGLKVVLFDRSRFKLFALRFSNKSCIYYLKMIMVCRGGSNTGLHHNFHLIQNFSNKATNPRDVGTFEKGTSPILEISLL